MNNKLCNQDFVNHSIYLDHGAEPFYEEDQVYNSCPVRFPTVSFYVQASDGLTELADAIREESGFLPMFPTEKHPADYDDDGWYDFYIGINGYKAGDPLNSCIDFYVVSDYAEDHEQHYTIDIPEEARETVYRRLDDQARSVFGMSCTEMLEAAKREMLQSA